MYARIQKTKLSLLRSAHLFVPVGPECNPYQDQGLHQGAADHTAPNTLQPLYISSSHRIKRLRRRRQSDGEERHAQRGGAYRCSEVKVEA